MSSNVEHSRRINALLQLSTLPNYSLYFSCSISMSCQWFFIVSVGLNVMLLKVIEWASKIKIFIVTMHCNGFDLTLKEYIYSTGRAMALLTEVAGVLLAQRIIMLVVLDCVLGRFIKKSYVLAFVKIRTSLPQRLLPCLNIVPL